MYQEPLARVLAIEEIGGTISVTLSIEDVLHPPFAPSSLYSLVRSDQLMIELHRLVDRADNRFTFHSYSSNVDAPRPTVGESYVFQVWWSPHQLALAQDRDRSWERQTFEAIDAIETILPDGTRILRPFGANANIEGSDSVAHAGWDHEHCALCWQRISALESDDPIGYYSEGEWICQACYQRYISSGFGSILGDQASL